MTLLAGLETNYARLPPQFFTLQRPTAVGNPQMIIFNSALAEELGLDPAQLADSAELWSGNRLPDSAKPLAMAYAGHQFGQFVPQLGDGRALLLGELTDRHGQVRELQLKGAGATPFSRGGDGRAALGPVLREYLLSEAMHALGIATTRALAAVTTGEQVIREGLLPGAVLTRVASSHIRVGTFQYFAARGDTESVRALAAFVMDRHYPQLHAAPQPHLALIEAIADRQARLVAQWLGVGFIHGVMNTDNMAVGGETIDYGPCAFMDNYDPQTVFSSIDRGGRYAYANQPVIAQWNLARLAETLIPLLDRDEALAIAQATEVINRFPALHHGYWLAGMRDKLGWHSVEDDDGQRIDTLLSLMQAGAADYTLLFRRLCECADAETGDDEVLALFADPDGVTAWLADWRQRCRRDRLPAADRGAAMRSVNPAIIPRNHQVETVLEAAIGGADFAPFQRLHTALLQPFAASQQNGPYAAPPGPEFRNYRTFCGT